MAATAPDSALEQAQDAAHGIAVHELGDVALDRPNSSFCRDAIARARVGAFLDRPASAARAGEERQAAAALARIGGPIPHSVIGGVTFESADVAVVSQDLVFVAEGQRTKHCMTGAVILRLKDVA